MRDKENMCWCHLMALLSQSPFTIQNPPLFQNFQIILQFEPLDNFCHFSFHETENPHNILEPKKVDEQVFRSEKQKACFET